MEIILKPMKDFNDILNSLPTSWDNFKLKDFKKTLDIGISESTGIEAMFDGANNTVKVLAALTDIEPEYFENLPLSQFQQLGKRLAFMQTEPAINKKSSIKWKTFETLSYNDYVVYMQHADKPLENMTILMQAFIADKLTAEQIENLSMVDCHTGFFLLKKYLRKYTRRTIQSTSKKLMQVQMKNLCNLIRGNLKRKAKNK